MSRTIAFIPVFDMFPAQGYVFSPPRKGRPGCVRTVTPVLTKFVALGQIFAGTSGETGCGATTGTLKWKNFT